jgi:spore germination protein GerM
MRHGRWVAGCALLFVLAGCAVGGQQHATQIPSGDLPSVLLQPSESPSTSPSVPQLSSTIYLIDDKRKTLVAVHRPRTQTSTLTGLIRSLLKGPTDAEAAAGLTTAINTSPTLNKVTIDGSGATLDLSSSFGEIRGPEQILATAQLVMTAVSFPGTDSVEISLDGVPASAPLPPNGALATGPLRLADYASLLAGAAPTPRA